MRMARLVLGDPPGVLWVSYANQVNVRVEQESAGRLAQRKPGAGQCH